MIIHRYSDGSEGYQYAPGDRVIVERTIHGGWFNYGPTRAERCTVRRLSTPENWRTGVMDIHYSDEWGCASCYPWMIRPHADTLRAATILVEEQAESVAAV
ncbi:hypothetical protein [Paraburkholderia humisilvae]|uniref:Nitrile hydratase beta subunit domain-containing protein n=1 Tax=Paraburkholderia humisilvae TaxID=627669 RepID=A0A6J5DIC3_9BURK|nr:hypothetical protein [Paraburkholderia humisilvae]CAB3753949.1 hypothetical protein LMG29542_02199 [Paraburkholderia humisilvae]